jgi:hypothetical protein
MEESMSSNETRPSPSSIPQRDDASPRKRFRIEKLEERIAPKKGGKGTNNCGGGGGSSNAASSGSTSIF